eukprot:gb/GEZN01003285.1/.p1 GENE.gb/GEZN01003285.1/~~gb/GEZN01003285.1/.p1  ORF type:complete len:533 (+),score=30.42 gb/GEZN01003285.1/:91-1689(+)
MHCFCVKPLIAVAVVLSLLVPASLVGFNRRTQSNVDEEPIQEQTFNIPTRIENKLLEVPDFDRKESFQRASTGISKSIPQFQQEVNDSLLAESQRWDRKVVWSKVREHGVSQFRCQRNTLKGDQSGARPMRCMCVFDSVVWNGHVWSLLLYTEDASILTKLLQNCPLILLDREDKPVEQVQVLVVGQTNKSVRAWFQDCSHDSFVVLIAAGQNQFHMLYDKLSVVYSALEEVDKLAPKWTRHPSLVYGIFLQSDDKFYKEIYSLFGTSVVISQDWLAGKARSCMGRAAIGHTLFRDPADYHYRDMLDLMHARMGTCDVCRSKRIVMLNRQHHSRNITNFPSFVKTVRAKFSKYGWVVEPVVFDSMSQIEQAFTLRRAAVFIGVHGSGLSNFVWMYPGSLYLQIDSYKVITSWWGMDCFQLLASRVNPGVESLIWENKDINLVFPKSYREILAKCKNDTCFQTQPNKHIVMQSMVEVDATAIVNTLAQNHVFKKLNESYHVCGCGRERFGFRSPNATVTRVGQMYARKFEFIF